jgi:autotransporter-associated beta strand protein
MFLNLNGGTLQFSAGAIVNGWTALNVNFNGAIIDTLTNDVTFIQALVAGDGLHGGLTKLGSGTLTLSGLNAYSGNTAVSDGTLSLSFSPGVNNISSSPVINVGAGATFDVSGVTDGFQLANAQTLSGNGTVNGAVTVAAGGTLVPGNATSIGALTFSNALTLNGNTVMKLSKSQSPSHDEVVVNGGLTFGGALIVTNLGPALALGDRFSLFSAPGTDTFATLNLPPLGSGLAWSNKLGVDGTIEVVAQAPPPQPQFSSISQSGTNLILVYGGATNQTARVLSSTDVALPIVNWTPVQTNIVGADGKFTNSIPVNPSEPQRFYRISIP